MSCTVNPFVAREAKYPLAPAARPRNIMVVGGGLAGMETAMYLTERGHRVALYEKEKELGGQWNIACALPGKKGYAALTDYLKRWLDRHGVETNLGWWSPGRWWCRRGRTWSSRPPAPFRGPQRPRHRPAPCYPGA